MKSRLLSLKTPDNKIKTVTEINEKQIRQHKFITIIFRISLREGILVTTTGSFESDVHPMVFSTKNTKHKHQINKMCWQQTIETIPLKTTPFK